MEKALTDKVDIPVIFGFLLVLGIAYFTMSNNSEIVSNLISLNFPYVLIIFARQYYRMTIRQSYIILLIISTVLVFVNITLSGSGGFDYYKKAIMYISTLSWFICCANLLISQKTLNWIFTINLLLIGLYLVFYKEGFEVFEEEILLTLNFSNPNLTGMFLLHSLLYVGIFTIGIGSMSIKKEIKLILLLICVYLFANVFGLLMLTGNRSSLMSLIVFGLLVMMDILIGQKIWLKKWIFILLATLPFVFVFIYVTFAGEIDDPISFSMSSEGKTNTSRIHVWVPIINNFWHYFIGGDYYGISNGTGMSQLHNTHLDIYASYGIIPLILYIILLYKLMYNSYGHTHSLIQRAGLYAFMSVLVLCTFEASLVAGSAGLFLLTGGFLLITNLNYSKGNNISNPKLT